MQNTPHAHLGSSSGLPSSDVSATLSILHEKICRQRVAAKHNYAVCIEPVGM